MLSVHSPLCGMFPGRALMAVLAHANWGTWYFYKQNSTHFLKFSTGKNSYVASSLFAPMKNSIFNKKRTLWGNQTVFPWSTKTARSPLLTSQYSLSCFDNKVCQLPKSCCVVIIKHCKAKQTAQQIKKHISKSAVKRPKSKFWSNHFRTEFYTEPWALAFMTCWEIY